MNSAISGPFTLSPSDNPLTITSTGPITSAGAGVGIDGGGGTTWIIRNRVRFRLLGDGA